MNYFDTHYHKSVYEYWGPWKKKTAKKIHMKFLTDKTKVTVTKNHSLSVMTRNSSIGMNILDPQPTAEGYGTQVGGYTCATCRAYVQNALIDHIWESKRPVLKTLTHFMLFIYIYGKDVFENVFDGANLIRLLNALEESFKFENRSFMSPTNVDQGFVVHMPVEWSKSSVTISLYTLLVRAGVSYRGKEEPWVWLENTAQSVYTTEMYPLTSTDHMWLVQCISKIKLLRDGGVYPEKLEAIRKPLGLVSSVHNFGISYVTEGQIKLSQKEDEKKEV